MLEAAGRFAAVVRAGTPIAVDLRLDLDLAELYQDFSGQPGSVHFKLRAQLLNMNRRQVLATQQFDYAAAIEADNAASGVKVLNTLLAEFLPELAAFCIDNGLLRTTYAR